MASSPSFHSLDDHIEHGLLEARRVYFSGVVTGETTNDAIRKMWYLELQAPKKPISLIINSPGGSVDAGFALWDQIKAITSPVTTVVTGVAASMGSVLSLVAAPGRRFATPNARVMIHQPSIHGVIEGDATDLGIQAKEILKTRDRLIDLYARATGKERDVIRKAIDRDSWMSAEEARDYGLLDKVITSLSDLD